MLLHHVISPGLPEFEEQPNVTLAVNNVTGKVVFTCSVTELTRDGLQYVVDWYLGPNVLVGQNVSTLGGVVISLLHEDSIKRLTLRDEVNVFITFL